MTIISAKDASVLAYLARHENADKKRTKKITSGLRGNALSVAMALTGQRSTIAANRAAKGLRGWAKDNERIAEKTVVRSSGRG
jgi:predicted transcriptional regulator